MLMRIMMFPAMLLIMLYCVIALIMPTMQNINAEKQVTLVKTGERDAAQKRLEEVRSVMRTVEEHATESEFLGTFLPNNQREEILINDIAQLAENSGVSLFSVSFSESSKGAVSEEVASSALRVVEGQIEATGSYENMKKFIAELLHIKRFNTFKDVELTKVEQKNTEGEEEVSQDQNISAALSFAYGYVPGQIFASPSEVQKQINYEGIAMIMHSGSQTEVLKSEPQPRVNPFLP